jgi:hypothetical protein
MGSLREPLAFAADVLGEQDAAEFCEVGGWVVECSDDEFAFGDAQAEHFDVAA